MTACFQRRKPICAAQPAAECARRTQTFACCALAEQLQAWAAQDEQTQGGTVASENVDGYSVSYSTPQGFADEAWEIVKIYLLDSGVLYGGTL